MKYRKTALIEATQWHRHGDHPAVGHLPDGHEIVAHAILPDDFGWISTLEGGYVVTPGDWIAGPGAAGEYWPIKDAVFTKTYELATD